MNRHNWTRRLRSALGSMLVIACFGAVGCHEKSVKPGINDSYKNADVDKWTARFESESREIYQQRDGILAAVGVAPGMEVADVGAGTGFMAQLFAEAVGTEGLVYAVDITPEFLELILDRMADAGVTNVKTVLCEEDSVKLPAQSVDLVFVCDTYHHFEYPRGSMRSIHRALRPRGQVVIIDFKREPGVSREWIIGHVRAGKDEVVREVSAVGFELLEDVPTPFLEENYMLRFGKTD